MSRRPWMQEKWFLQEHRWTQTGSSVLSSLSALLGACFPGTSSQRGCSHQAGSSLLWQHPAALVFLVFPRLHLKAGPCCLHPRTSRVGRWAGGGHRARSRRRRLGVSRNNSELPTAWRGVSRASEADNGAFFQNERMRLFSTPAPPTFPNEIIKLGFLEGPSGFCREPGRGAERWGEESGRAGKGFGWWDGVSRPAEKGVRVSEGTGEGPLISQQPRWHMTSHVSRSPGLQPAVYTQHVFGIIGVFIIITVVLKGTRIN